MLTRNMLCPLIYANMKLNKASNIAVHFSVFGSLSLIYRIKNNLKLFVGYYARTKRVSIVPRKIRRGINYRDLFSSLFPQPVAVSSVEMKFDHASKPFSGTIAAFGSIVPAGLVLTKPPTVWQ